MSVFGKGRPVVKIVSTSEEIELLFTALFPTFVDKRIIENESPLNGARTWITLFNQAEFKLTVHLHAYEDRVATFNDLKVLEDAFVYFKPYKSLIDGSTASYIKDEFGLLVPFRCTQFEPYNLNDIYNFDCLDLTFKSSRPVSLLNTEIIAILP